MTFRELYESSLLERIAAGGDARNIVRLVNAYQGTDIVARIEEFEAWRESERFRCERCKFDFSGAVDKGDEWGDVLCIRCRTGFRMGVEPMPGWNRTWSR